MNINKTFTFAALAVIAAVLSACSIDLERNPDGSLTATTVITAESLSDEIEQALRGPDLQNVDADMHQGYITVSGERVRLDGSQTDTMSFRLDLGVADGHLTATISDLQVNGQPAADERVSNWNERIAARLERNADAHPNRTLQSVTVGEQDLTMVWHIETPRSRSDEQ